ncbi:tyrosine-type recombinase/integrase [Paenalcaligenes suwonensis]|uniref:tyrosine-type recombinase/integrase n=1 Tax=Paenalcaligenes suwonensis TaxID=1202713 RepID=UPI0031017D3F
MDLIYLTGQRPADTLSISETDIRNNEIEITQGKTGKRLRISIQGDLKEVIDRMLLRKSNIGALSQKLLVNESGQALSSDALRSRFDRVRNAA